MFKRADLGKYLGIEDIRRNFKDFPSHYTRPRLDLEAGDRTLSLKKTKNPHEVFINLNGSLEIAVRSKKPKAVALIKWHKRHKKIQEEHKQAIREKDNQIQALEATNENINSRF